MLESVTYIIEKEHEHGDYLKYCTQKWTMFEVLDFYSGKQKAWFGVA